MGNFGGVIHGDKSWWHYTCHMIFVILWCAFVFSVQRQDAFGIALPWWTLFMSHHFFNFVDAFCILFPAWRCLRHCIEAQYMSHYVFRSQLFWSLLCHMLYLEASPSVHSFFFVSILLIFRPFLVLFGIVLSFFSYKVLIALFYGFSLQYFGPTSEGTLHNRLLCCLLRCLSFPSYYVSNLFCGQPHTTFHGKILSQV